MKTKREQILQILTESFLALKESVGHEVYTDLVTKVSGDIMDLNKPKAELVHIIGPNGEHRLQVDGETTPWMKPHEIAKKNDFVAATDHYMDQLPQVSRVVAIDPEHFRTESAQSLSLETFRFHT